MFNKGNMSKMLKQAQGMQAKMAAVQKELDKVIVEESTGDLVTVRINGKMEVLDIQVSSEALSEEKEVLEDILVSTMNKAIAKVQEDSQRKMNSVTGNMLGGLNLPGM